MSSIICSLCGAVIPETAFFRYCTGNGAEWFEHLEPSTQCDPIGTRDINELWKIWEKGDA